MVNSRASAMFEMAGAAMWGGAVRGDALMVLDTGGEEYERSLPPELISIFMSADRPS